MIKKHLLKPSFTALSLLIFLTGCNTPKTNEININNNNIVQSANSNSSEKIDLNRIIVKFKKNRFSSNTLNSLAKKHRSNVEKRITSLSIAVFKSKSRGISANTLSSLQNDPNVEYVVRDSKVELDEVNVNDPELKKQYALEITEAKKAWGITMGSPKVTIGIIDTGVDLNHIDLKAKLLKGYNSMDTKALPIDDHGHGTHVSGIAAAITNNGTGIAGLAPNCKILPVKALSSSGGSLSTIADGLVWAADHGADVINMSLGTYTDSPALKDAIDYAAKKNIVLIATMGNNGIQRKRYPAAYENVIAVGATNSNDKIASYSNFGNWMSVSAPGTDILSSVPGSNYREMSGTSMAAPLVTGLAALIKSKFKNISSKEVEKKLQNSADDLGAKGFDNKYGHGRVNAYNALK